MKVKKDCQVIISPLIQSMLGFRQAIFPVGDYVSDWAVNVKKGLNSLCVYWGSNTRVIISPSLPSTGTILNDGTWASPTILDSTKGQYTYREFNPLVRTTKAFGLVTGWVLFLGQKDSPSRGKST
jgi:hypothetical protein